MLMRLLLFLFLIIFSPQTGLAQSPQIYMDGKFSDWQSLSPIHSDPTGDQAGGFLDFGNLWGTNDDKYFYLRIEVGGEMNLQDLNNISVYLDTDNNSSTGIQVHGMGAELKWNFGPRNGLFAVGSTTYSISHNQIGLVTAPTITSTEFEISLLRDAMPVGQNLLFPSNTIRILFIDYGPGQDRLPDVGSVLFSFNSQNPSPITPISIKKKQGNSIRFLSYNVLFDGLFDPTKVATFNRILKAIEPEIIGFQEIYNHDAQQTAAQVEAMLPSIGQQQWYAEKAGPDNIAVSRFPIENTYTIDGNGAFVINLSPQYSSKLLFIVAHLPCCGNNQGRQLEVDAIMAFIRDAKTPGGTITLPSNTPIIIVGDLNLVGFAQQLTTLLTGDIINTGTFGQPFSPDWDNSDFTDLIPRHTSQPQFFTWFNTGSSFSPGRLDFMIYSDSVIESKKSFVLFTPEMSADSLTAYNLLENDVIVASDHIPVVSDFRLTSLTGFDDIGQTYPDKFLLKQNYPNPFNPSTTIIYEIPEKSKIKIAIYNSLGQLVKTLLDNETQAGTHTVVWDSTNQNGEFVGSGFYIVRMVANSKTDHFINSKQILLIR